MYCKHCGKRIDEDSTFCMHCGKPTGVVPQQQPNLPAAPNSKPVLAEQQATSSIGVPACPNCGRFDAVRHIRSIIAQDITGFQSATRTVGYGASIGRIFAGEGGITSVSGDIHSSVSQSEGVAFTPLAAKLVDTLNGVDEHNRSLLQPPPSTYNRSQGNETYQRYMYWVAELQLRNSLLEGNLAAKYKVLQYCSRCGGVFLPSDHHLITLPEFERYFYQYPSTSDHDFCMVGTASRAEMGIVKGKYWRRLFTTAYDSRGFHVDREQGWWEDSDAHFKRGSDEFYERGDNALPAVLRGAYSMRHPMPNCAMCSAQHQRFLGELGSEGWVPANETGKYWYQTLLVRPHRS